MKGKSGSGAAPAEAEKTKAPIGNRPGSAATAPQLQPGSAQRSRTLQSGAPRDAALPEVAAALLRQGRLTAWLCHARLCGAGRVCRQSLLRSRLIGRAGLLTWPRRHSRLRRAWLLQSLPAWLTGLLRLTGPRRLAWLARLLRLTWPRLQTLPVRCAGLLLLLLSRTILQSGLLRCARPIL